MMPPPRTHRFHLILVGIDFSRQSARALRYAAATARAAGGRVVALHAVDPLLTLARVCTDYPIVEETHAGLERFVRQTLGAEAARVIACSVAIGPPHQTLTAEARRLRADVVVLGTSGRRGGSTHVLGSTSEALLRHYEGPVMVVPPRCAECRDDWPGSMVATVAPGSRHPSVLSAAARTAHVFGAWLTLAEPPRRRSRARWHPAPLIVLPLPDAARLQAFRQGSAAYAFVRRTAVPVIVVHTGRRIGHLETSRPAG